jgi:hypothetical protein
MAAFAEQRFLDDFHRALAGQLAIRRALAAKLPEGVTAQVRTDGKREAPDRGLWGENLGTGTGMSMMAGKDRGGGAPAPEGRR